MTFNVLYWLNLFCLLLGYLCLAFILSAFLAELFFSRFRRPFTKKRL